MIATTDQAWIPGRPHVVGRQFDYGYNLGWTLGELRRRYRQCMGMRLFNRFVIDRVLLSDLAWPTLFAVVGTAEFLSKGVGPYWASVGTFWLAALALSARRAWPVAMPLVVVGAYLLAGLLGVAIEKSASWMALFGLACFAAGQHGGATPWRGLLSTLGCFVVATLALNRLTTFSPDLIFGVLWTVTPWFLGLMLHRSLARNRQLAAAAERERMAHRMAVVAERERIARELHDMLADSLSVMVVQASLAEDLLATDREAAAAALHEVQQCGRNALGETGQLLRLIREEGQTPARHAQLTLADLAELADEFRRAGMAVELRLSSALESLPVGLQMSAYRIVQEGLTNALKHAPGAAVEVAVTGRNGSLEVEVRNGPAAGTPSRPVESGHGLVGMRERVSLFGGTLCAEPVAGGGFRLAATLLMGAGAA